MRVMLPVGRTGLSIVAGYLGLLALFVVPAPLALAVGIWALVDLKEHPDKSGMGRAIFAIVMGALGSIALALLMLR
jgi:sugar phosphate permease